MGREERGGGNSYIPQSTRVSAFGCILGNTEGEVLSFSHPLILTMTTAPYLGGDARGVGEGFRLGHHGQHRAFGEVAVSHHSSVHHPNLKQNKKSAIPETRKEIHEGQTEAGDAQHHRKVNNNNKTTTTTHPARLVDAVGGKLVVQVQPRVQRLPNLLRLAEKPSRELRLR